MILITAREVPGDVYKLLKGFSTDEMGVSREDFPINLEMAARTVETIEGRRFVLEDGREVVVGMSEEAQRLVEIQEQAFKDLEERNEYLGSKLLDSWIALNGEKIAHKWLRDKMACATFWQRLKWLFTGIPFRGSL